MVSKRIDISTDLNEKISQTVLKLELKESRNVSQEEVILRYISEGLERDEKKLKSIKV